MYQGHPPDEAATSTIVVTIGHEEIDLADLGEDVPLPPTVRNPMNGREAADLRSWGTALLGAIDAHGPEALAAQIALPKLDPLLGGIAEHTDDPTAAYDVVLVASDQGEGPLAFTDTFTLCAALARLLPPIGERAGLRVARATVATLTGAPTDFAALWPQTSQVVDLVSGHVHLALVGATSAMRHALLVRFFLARDLGEIDDVTSWALGRRPGRPSEPIVERSLEFISAASATGHLRDLTQSGEFDELTRVVRGAQRRAVLLALPSRSLELLRALAPFANALANVDLVGARELLDADRTGSLASWHAAVAEASFPVAPGARGRSALDDLRPVYGLLLDALELRWRQRDMVATVSLLHLASEYAVHLAWQSVFGHPGDPRRLMRDAIAPGSRFGSDDEACPHRAASASLARQVRLGAPSRGTSAWTRFLTSSYSRLDLPLTQCALRRNVAYRSGDTPAMNCETGCGFVGRLPPASRQQLEVSVALAALLSRSDLIGLRHQAPPGHFFDVPTPAEVDREWSELVRKVPDRLGHLPIPDDLHALHHGPLPRRLAAFLSLIAGTPIAPAGVLPSVGRAMLACLDPE